MRNVTAAQQPGWPQFNQLLQPQAASGAQGWSSGGAPPASTDTSAGFAPLSSAHLTHVRRHHFPLCNKVHQKMTVSQAVVFLCQPELSFLWLARCCASWLILSFPTCLFIMLVFCGTGQPPAPRALTHSRTSTTGKKGALPRATHVLCLRHTSPRFPPTYLLTLPTAGAQHLPRGGESRTALTALVPQLQQLLIPRVKEKRSAEITQGSLWRSED